MNPLSSWTYYRRHKAQASILLGLSIMVTIGIYSMVALVWGVFVEPARMSYMALSRFSLVTLEYDNNGPDPAVIAQIDANPDIAMVIPSSAIKIELPSIMAGSGVQFELHGLMAEDLPGILERCSAVLMHGQLPKPGENGLLISADIAAILNVKVGDSYDVVSSEFYAYSGPAPEATTFEVVGILDSDVELGIVSREFLLDHEYYGKFPTRLLILAQDNREEAVDAFLRDEIQTAQTSVMTLSMLNERILLEALPTLLMLLPVILIVALVFSLVIVVINQFANAQRLVEFGILHAAGLSKKWLVRRLTRETTLVALLGWLIGISISWLFIYLLKAIIFVPHGHDLTYIPWIPIILALPIPAAIAASTFISVRRTFARLDPVTIIDRGVLSQEGGGKRGRTVSKSSPKPLAAATFYLRHRGRAVLLVSGMSLMILAVVLIFFTLAVSADAQEDFFRYLQQVSIVRSPGSVASLAPDVVARVESHPAVERVIPIAPRYHLLGVNIPPFSGADASPFAVYGKDMAYLIDLYGLKLKEGRLPHPNTNEMVISETLAQNRGIKLGDVIGNPDHPVYPGAPSLEAEFVVSGIFARPETSEDGSALGFISLEHLESEKPFPIPDVLPLMVVPKPGYKQALDVWLENELSRSDVSVLTYQKEVSRIRRKTQQDMFAMMLLEGIIAIIAAAGLSVLNYTFISQRKSEFAVLHALGFARRKLVGRVFSETLFTTGIAVGLSISMFLIGLFYLRLGIYDQLGLSFNPFNLSPWLYTLPIPISVLAITTGAIARALTKLDPVSLIERRL